MIVIYDQITKDLISQYRCLFYLFFFTCKAMIVSFLKSQSRALISIRCVTLFVWIPLLCLLNGFP